MNFPVKLKQILNPNNFIFKHVYKHVNNHLLIGIFCYFVWFLLIYFFHPSPVVDEKIHQRVISGIYEGCYDISGLSMLPGYHWIIGIIGKILSLSTLNFSRFITFLISVAMMIIYTKIPYQNNAKKLTRTPYLLLFLPILFPYTVMVYTDAVALFFIISAIYFHKKKYYILAGLSMFLSCLIRQSNILWVIFMIAWSMLDVWDQINKEIYITKKIGKTFFKDVLSRISCYIIALVFIILILLANGDFLASNVPLIRPRFNISSYFTLSFFILLLWLPIWIERFKEDIRFIIFAFKNKPIKTGLLFLILTLIGIILVLFYKNWHPWNQDTWFLRNIPLVMMDRYIPYRILGVLCIFFAGYSVFRLWSIQSNRGQLTLLAIFILAFLSPHSLVEPRYLIVPFVLSDLFMDYSNTQIINLKIWYSSINAIFCILIIFDLSFL